MVLAKKPIEVFKSDKQFQEVAKNYQHKLFLDDWFIIFGLTKEPITADDGQILWGYCNFSYENASASIMVFNGDLAEQGIDADSKNIAELTLLHELLHLKMEYMTDKDIVGDLPLVAQSLKHRGLESLAKSILMFKYGIDYDYFMGNTIMLTVKDAKNVKA